MNAHHLHKTAILISLMVVGGAVACSDPDSQWPPFGPPNLTTDTDGDTENEFDTTGDALPDTNSRDVESDPGAPTIYGTTPINCDGVDVELMRDVIAAGADVEQQILALVPTAQAHGSFGSWLLGYLFLNNEQIVDDEASPTVPHLVL